MRARILSTHVDTHARTQSGEGDSDDLENLERADAFPLPCSLGKRVKDKFGSYDRFRNDLFAARFQYLRNDILSNLFLALRNGILNIYSISFFAQPRTNGKNRGKINFPRLFLFRHIPRKGSNYRDEISIKIKFNDCTRNKSNFSFPLLLRASYKCALFLLFFLLFLRVPFFPPFPFREFVS